VQGRFQDTGLRGRAPSSARTVQRSSSSSSPSSALRTAILDRVTEDPDLLFDLMHGNFYPDRVRGKIAEYYAAVILNQKWGKGYDVLTGVVVLDKSQPKDVAPPEEITITASDGRTFAGVRAAPPTAAYEKLAEIDNLVVKIVRRAGDKPVEI